MTRSHITTQWFKNAGDAIILVGAVAGVADPGSEKPDRASPAEVNALGYNLGGSRYLKICHGLKIGPPPHVDLELEIKVQNAVRDLIRAGLVKSAHDCSEGGLGVALAECCFNPEQLFGAEINVARASGLPEDESAVADLRGEEDRKRDACATLFNESQSRIIISVAANDAETNDVDLARVRCSLSAARESRRR